MTNILKVDTNICTGCSACANICPTGAITMQENQEGFLYPKVDNKKCTNCGLCLKKCPATNTTHDNKTPKNAIAFMAQDKERMKSSSGGAFIVLAKHFIENKGIVCGGIWDNDWTVKHIISNTEEDIEKMRTSKYMQSKIENIYKEIENILKQEKQVLFTGTPCQIAGLKSYLQKDYKKLYCVDIVCHGVPSAKLFKKYLNENYETNEIKNIDFRDKKTYGWGGFLKIAFKNNEEKTIKWNYDSFYSLFEKDICLRKSCETCKFNKLPRQGDLTIGDFWGIEKKFNDKKGTSCILVNNKKGEFLLKLLKQNAKLFKKQPLKKAFEKNPNIIQPTKAHPDREKFFRAMDFNSTDELKRYFIDDYCDCMVLNFWSALNYGAILTCFGVQCLLEELGQKTKIINYVSYPNELKCDFKESFAYKFANEYFNLTKPIEKYSDLLKLNQRANTFVVGSDQVWRKSCIKELINNDFSWTMYFLDFVRSCNKKISYSASFGIDNIEGTAIDIEKMYYYLAQFDNISVREKLAKTLIENRLKLNSKVLIDSVFHISKDLLNEMTEKHQTKEEYIGCFVLPYFSKQTWYKEKLKDISNKLNLPIKTMEFSTNTTVEEWLSFIKNAKFLISDSYHAITFAIIFNIPFIQIKNAKSQNRFESLFDLLEIKNKTISEFSQKEFEINTAFDWQKINAIIKNEKQEAKNWMKNALEKEKEQKFIQPHFLEAEIIKLKNSNKLK